MLATALEQMPSNFLPRRVPSAKLGRVEPPDLNNSEAAQALDPQNLPGISVRCRDLILGRHARPATGARVTENRTPPSIRRIPRGLEAVAGLGSDVVV
jgi:hypothetical protein